VLFPGIFILISLFILKFYNYTCNFIIGVWPSKAIKTLPENTIIKLIFLLSILWRIHVLPETNQGESNI